MVAQQHLRRHRRPFNRIVGLFPGRSRHRLAVQDTTYACLPSGSPTWQETSYATPVWIIFLEYATLTVLPTSRIVRITEVSPNAANPRFQPRYARPAHPSAVLATTSCLHTRTQAPGWRRGLYPRPKLHKRIRALARTNPATYQWGAPDRDPPGDPAPRNSAHRTRYRLCPASAACTSEPESRERANRNRTNEFSPCTSEPGSAERSSETCTNEFACARANPRALRPQMKIAQTNCRRARANPRRVASLGSPHVQLETRFAHGLVPTARWGSPTPSVWNVTFVTVRAL